MFATVGFMFIAVTTATTDPPKLSDTYTSVVTTKTTGNIPGLPHGESTYTEYYDYTNKRRRLDFTSGSMEGQTKVYRYDVQDMNHNPFAAPRGYQFETRNPKLSWCDVCGVVWWWCGVV